MVSPETEPNQPNQPKIHPCHIAMMGRRCRQIFLFIAAFSFLRGLQVGFVSEDSLRIGFIGDLLSSANKSDDSAHATTPTIPFSEVRKRAFKTLKRATLEK